MAICLILENPDQSPEQAGQVMARVRDSGPVPPEGARLVIAGPGDPGWRVISVWDSSDAMQRFLAMRLAPAYADAGLSLDATTRTVFDVHNLIAGDLVGAPQPA